MPRNFYNPHKFKKKVHSKQEIIYIKNLIKSATKALHNEWKPKDYFSYHNFIVLIISYLFLKINSLKLELS